jgi:hypothetical protein
MTCIDNIPLSSKQVMLHFRIMRSGKRCIVIGVDVLACQPFYGRSPETNYLTSFKKADKSHVDGHEVGYEVGIELRTGDKFGTATLASGSVIRIPFLLDAP